jgi:thioredoxin-like negative regulator of GroEL
MTKRRVLGLWSAAGLMLLLAMGAGALAVYQRSLRAELEEARTAFDAGHFAVASKGFSRLAKRWTNDGEVLWLLGESELKRGRREEALAVWAKLSPSSPFFGSASLRRATHLINSGRYAPVEEILLQALADPARSPRYELERALSRLYRFEGRFDEVRQVVRASWSRSPTPAADLKELWNLDHSAEPVEAWKHALEKADVEDDRVWLGLANQAILTGHFVEASAWLDRCASRRPEDPSVWLARLELAVATGDVAGFWGAAPHVPANRLDPASAGTFRAWLAARSNDPKAEQRAIESLLETDPANATAIERLAVILVLSGRAGDAQALHLKKAELDRARDKYRKMLYDGLDLSSRAGVLSELTGKLGRRFDAQAWSLIADAGIRDPGPTGAGSRREDAASPLPPLLADRAAALSAAFATLPASASQAGPSLGEQLADLGPPKTNPPATSTVVADLGAGSESSRPTPEFIDDAETAGLRFIFDNGQTPRRLFPETMSGGVALFDFDGDGWIDVYCVQGGALEPSTGGPAAAKPAALDRLFRNRGNGTFEDVTEPSGIAGIAWSQGYGLGAAVGDYDNDGHPDLLVTRLQTYTLCRNRGDGTFEDVTRRTGLAAVRNNPTSAAFADLDNDGDLDLYVCHYMFWDPAHPKLCKNDKGAYFYCDPAQVAPAPDHVYRNDGGRFVDVTESSGCFETEGRGLGVVAADLDGDDRIDLYVANDGTANYFFHNKGGFRFEEIALQAGVAGSAVGGFQAGMGVACGDLDGDGRPDLMVTNFYGEGTTLYQNLGDRLFADRSAASGIGLATRYLLGFGIAMADVTNDGLLDVMITNGHVNDNRPYSLYSMPSRLYENRPDGRLVDVSSQAGPPWNIERVGRALADGDLDNDGLMDAVIVAQNDPVAFFHNQTKRAGNFVTFRLEGTKSNRDGVGAKVTVTSAGRRQTAQRQGGGSYQSAGDPRLHFGLGDSANVEQVEIHWPSGRTDRWTDLPANTGYLLREGHAAPLPLAGFARRPLEKRPKANP